MFDMDGCYNEKDYADGGEISMPIAKCAHCGKGIFQPDEAMVIDVNKCAIHIDCWEDYATENYEEFLSDFYG